MVGVPAGSAHEFVLLLGDLWFQFWSLIQLDSIIFGKRAGWLTCVQQLQKKKSSSILALHAKYMLLGAWKFVGVLLDGCVPGVWEAACIFNIKY